MSYLIAVDVGGTQMRAACYRSGSTTPVNLQRIPTQGGGRTPQENLLAVIQSVIPADGLVSAIGVASPGPIDLERNLIITAPNIPQWSNFPIVAYLEDYFHVPVALDNDANLAALGEWKFGAGQGYHHLVYVTISTGVGGGVIIEDRLLHGRRGMAAELGHITVDPAGPLCGCGQRGHLEALASGTAIARAAREAIQRGEPTSLPAGETITARHVAEAATRGDALSLRIINQAAAYLGCALADFLHIFNPTILILGGGVSRSGPVFMDPVRKALQQHALSPNYLEGLTLTMAAHGDEAGLIGALALAQSLSEKRSQE
jgi:glucokinase